MLSGHPPPPGSRVPAIDLARGVALLAMTVFHLCWDLELFGIFPPGTMASAVAIQSARLIASSFLMLVGISLALAHYAEIRWRAFWRRWIAIAAAALAITVATRIAFPDAFIFFGILHLIAVGSLLALPLLRLPAAVTALVGVAVIAIGALYDTPALDAPLWWWTGLSAFVPVSNDYVPLFPFLGPILLGVALGRWGRDRGAVAALATVRLNAKPARVLRFIGRHSLVYYLLHQPIMLAIIYTVLLVIGRI